MADKLSRICAGVKLRLLFLEHFQDGSPLLQINSLSITEHVGSSAVRASRRLRLLVKSLR